MTPVLCHVSDASLNVLRASAKAESVRDLIDQALAQGLTPLALPPDSQRRTIALPAHTLATLTAMGEHGVPPLSPGRVVGGLIHALARQAKIDLDRRELSNNPAALRAAQRALTLRCEQIAVIDQALPELLKHRIVLSEAGTGIGKTRVLLHLAYELLQQKAGGASMKAQPLSEGELQVATKQSALTRAHAARAAAKEQMFSPENEPVRESITIAVPSIDNLVHAVDEWAAVVNDIDPNRTFKVAFALGRNQFVSASRIAELLDEQEVADTGVASWLASGMPSGHTDASRSLARLHPGIRGLADDLAALATDFPVAEATLTPHDPEEDQVHYQSLRHNVLQSDLNIVTHAFVCQDSRNLARENRSHALPGMLALFVDEAHLFENAQSSASSTSLALSSLRRALHKFKTTKSKSTIAAALQAINSLTQRLQLIPCDLRLPGNFIEDTEHHRLWTSAMQSVRDLDASLKRLHKSLGDASTAQSRFEKAVLHDAMNTTRLLLEGTCPGQLSFSSKQRYPSIAVGPSTVSKYLAARWEVSSAVLLMSGTLLVPTEGGDSANHMASLLALDPLRTVTTPPVHPAWLKNEVTLLTCGPKTYQKLIPPSMKKSGHLYEMELKLWAAHQAHLINATVAATAKGGTLVLCTGYDRARLIAELIQDGQRVVLQDPVTLPFRAAKARFLELAKAGVRPIWFGVGPAWTGLDIRDKDQPDPAKDFLLTDLVIPATPFGTVRSNTHTARRHLYGFVTEKSATLLQLRQGLGRLSRRPGLTHRRIWFADGRIRHAGSRGLMAEIIRLLSRYRHLDTFETESNMDFVDSNFD